MRLLLVGNVPMVSSVVRKLAPRYYGLSKCFVSSEAPHSYNSSMSGVSISVL